MKATLAREGGYWSAVAALRAENPSIKGKVTCISRTKGRLTRAEIHSWGHGNVCANFQNNVTGAPVYDCLMENGDGNQYTIVDTNIKGKSTKVPWDQSDSMGLEDLYSTAGHVASAA